MYLMDHQPDSLRDGLTQAMHAIYQASNTGPLGVPRAWVPLVGACALFAVAPVFGPSWSLESLLTSL
jgi:hypothetical protein